MEQVEGGSAARDLATPETAVRREKDESEEPSSAKELDTDSDEDLQADREGMQPDSS